MISTLFDVTVCLLDSFFLIENIPSYNTFSIVLHCFVLFLPFWSFACLLFPILYFYGVYACVSVCMCFECLLFFIVFFFVFNMPICFLKRGKGGRFGWVGDSKRK